MIYRVNFRKHSELWSYNSCLDYMKYKQVWTFERKVFIVLELIPEKKVNFFETTIKLFRISKYHFCLY